MHGTYQELGPAPPVALDRVPVAYLQPKPLIRYSATTLTASANQDAETLSGTNSKPGIPLVADPMVNDSLLTYDSNWHAAGDREPPLRDGGRPPGDLSGQYG
ncbi:hypothetical protein ACWDV4_24775 [Micromonospora sp. NPDC003197]